MPCLCVSQASPLALFFTSQDFKNAEKLEFLPWVLSIFLEFWVFFLSFWSFFHEFWVFSLSFEFWVFPRDLSFFLCSVFLLPQLKAYLNSIWICRPYSKIQFLMKKCRNFEFSAWVSVFSLSFEFYPPWVFSRMAKGEAWFILYFSGRRRRLFMTG